MDDSAFTCDKIIEKTKTVPINFNKKSICKPQHFYILLPFLLISIALLIVVSVYYYLSNYKAKTALVTISRHKYRIINNINQKWVIKSKI